MTKLTKQPETGFAADSLSPAEHLNFLGKSLANKHQMELLQRDVTQRATQQPAEPIQTRDIVPALPVDSKKS